MKAGETKRYQCDECMHEFELCLEPKANNVPEDQKPKDEAEPTCCPFCGENAETYLKEV